MKVRSHMLSLFVARGVAVIVAVGVVATMPSTARAAGVVGTGTAASCTNAALDTALAGGGLATFNCGADPVTIDISTGTGTKTIAADTTIDGGGLITISGGNSVRVFAVNSDIKFSVEDLTIANGSCGLQCDNGGGIGNSGMLTVTNTTFSGNNANDSGGGIFNYGGTLTVTNSTFSGNSAGVFGGGIFMNSGTLTVTNTTFSGNSAHDDGGGIFSSGMTNTITNSTFSKNDADGGGGIFSSGTLTVRNTIVAKSASGSNCDGGVTDGGHNLDDGTSCGFSEANGSLSNTNPQLDPAGLANNGGPTQTVALCAGVDAPAGCTAASPAIGSGDQTICAAAPVNDLDQRGLARPGGCATECSIGAYEVNASTPICAGDCDGNGRVTIDELITGVDIALGATQITNCIEFVCLGTENVDAVTVPCLVRAVNAALDNVCFVLHLQIGDGCSGP